MKHSDTLNLIAPALVKALGKIEGASKTAVNGGFKTKYATLENVIDASRDILTEHGLTMIQLPGACVSGVMNLETILMHESGEWISGEMGIALGKTDPQGVGSALTYARRYAQMAALNMPAVDDDGESAMGRQPANQSAPAPHDRAPAPAKAPEPKRIAPADGVAPIPIKDRAKVLCGTMRAAAETGDPDKLRHTWDRGEVLRKEIDAKEPELLVEIEALYKELFEAMTSKVAA